MEAYDPSAEGDGKYIAAFAESAGEVSPIFEKKVREVFDRQLGSVDPDTWYRVDDIVEAFETIEDDTGEKTMEQAGKAAGEALPWPDGVETVREGLETLNELHKAAYRDSPDEYPAGRFTFDFQDGDTVRVGITGGYPYTEHYARGSIKGVVSGLTGTTPSLSAVDTNPEERAAWLVEY